MRGWFAAGVLVAAALFGAWVYVALNQQVYEQGINLNLKLLAVIGGLVVICVIALVMLRRKRTS